MITAEDLGGLLFGIHIHAESLLKFKVLADHDGKEFMDNPDQILYREKDILALLKKFGLPKPVWGKAMRLRDYKGCSV